MLFFNIYTFFMSSASKVLLSLYLITTTTEFEPTFCILLCLFYPGNNLFCTLAIPANISHPTNNIQTHVHKSAIHLWLFPAMAFQYNLCVCECLCFVLTFVVFGLECSGQVMCSSGGGTAVTTTEPLYCVHEKYYCDGHVNCALPGGGSDERGCPGGKSINHVLVYCLFYLKCRSYPIIAVWTEKLPCPAFKSGACLEATHSWRDFECSFCP